MGPFLIFADMKKCNSCGIEKEISDFSRDKNLKSGYRGNCKSCQKNYRESSSDKIKQYHREHYLKNKEKISEAGKTYYSNNKEKVLLRHKEYRRNNKESIREYYRIKRKDPMYRMICSLRTRVSAFCRGVKQNKPAGTFSMLGCPVDIFKKHIESKFCNGMSWDNYGEWHIDHIIPLSAANTREALIELNHYSNLQPLWGRDNISKGNRVL